MYLVVSIPASNIKSSFSTARIAIYALIVTSLGLEEPVSLHLTEIYSSC